MSTRRKGSGHASSRHEGPSSHSLFQYLDILRDRWLSASLAFIVVACVVGLHAFFSTPSYESYAVIQIESGESQKDRLAEISLGGAPANIAAELEVMASRSVAQRAAVFAGAGALISQENAYRPWESFLRQRTGSGAPARLLARILGRPGVAKIAPTQGEPERHLMPVRGGSFRLLFDGAGTKFTVEDAAGKDRGSLSFDPATGATIKIAGEQIQITLQAGTVKDRTFTLRLRTENEAAAWIQSMVRATEMGDYTGIVHLGAQADDPYLAKLVAASLSDSYLTHKKQRKRSQIQSRIDWIKEEMEGTRQDLRVALDARDKYVTKHGAILLGQKATAAFEALSTLFEQRLQQEQILMQEQTALEALQTTRTPEKVMAAVGASNIDTQTQALADSIVQLEVQRAVELRQGSTTEDPPVKRLDAEISEMKKRLAQRVEALRAEAEARFKRSIAAVNNRLQQIKEEVAKHDAVLADLPQEERQLAELARAVEAAQGRHVFLERMSGESKLALSSTLSQAHQIDAAILNTARKSPVLFRRSLVAIFLGLFAAIGIALLRHARDRTVQNPRDLEDGLGLQLYAAIPTFSSVPRRQRQGLNSSLVVRDAPTSILSENYRTLRANIRFADTGKPIQTMAITSALPGEGKTITTLNLAAAMARAGNSVVVVDADLRRPTVNIHLGGDHKPGIVEVLLGEIPWREALQDSGMEGLAFIAAGRKISDPSALLEAGHFEQMLKELRKEFEYILFDVPPALAVADAGAFFRSLDAVFLLSRQGACPLDIVAGAKEQVERFGGNLLGAIFNGFDAKKAGSRRYGYGGYYGYHGYYAEHGSGGARSDDSTGVDPEPGSGR